MNRSDIEPGKYPTSEQEIISKKPERLQSLDVLRGFDMVWITGGEGLIHALAVATGWGVFNVMSEQLHHVPWEGFHAYDLIFPLFMFISGVAVPFAFISKLNSGVSKKLLFRKALKRMVILVLFGIIYNQFWWNDWSNPRIASVLGQIGVAYFLASVIFLQTQKLRNIILWTLGILTGYSVLQLFVPVPGFGAGKFTPEGSINAYIDQLILPGLLLDKTFDPEGLLNMISATSVTLMGIIAGLILRNNNMEPYRKFFILLVTGIIIYIISSVAGNYYPIIKKMWTATYDMHAGGLSFMLIALFYLVVDIWKIRGWSFYFKVIGMNAITVYMGAHVFDFEYTVKGLLGGFTQYMGAYGDVVIWLGYLGLVWYILFLLYKNRIFLKV